MTEEKKKPEEDEVSEEQLEDVAGGATADATLQETTQVKQADKASAPLMQHLVEGDGPGTAEIDFVRSAGDDED
jgi:type VI protein secretion system component Hcp